MKSAARRQCRRGKRTNDTHRHRERTRCWRRLRRCGGCERHSGRVVLLLLLFGCRCRCCAAAGGADLFVFGAARSACHLRAERQRCLLRAFVWPAAAAAVVQRRAGVCVRRRRRRAARATPREQERTRQRARRVVCVSLTTKVKFRQRRRRTTRIVSLARAWYSSSRRACADGAQSDVCDGTRPRALCPLASVLTDRLSRSTLASVYCGTSSALGTEGPTTRSTQFDSLTRFLRSLAT